MKNTTITEKNKSDLKKVVEIINTHTFEDVEYIANFISNTNQSKDYLVFFTLKSKTSNLNNGVLNMPSKGFEISKIKNVKEFSNEVLEYLKTLSDVNGLKEDGIESVFNEIENKLMEEKRGGKRENSGAKPKYSEPTKTTAFRIPISKIEEVKAVVNKMLLGYAENNQ